MRAPNTDPAPRGADTADLSACYPLDRAEQAGIGRHEAIYSSKPTAAAASVPVPVTDCLRCSPNFSKPPQLERLGFIVVRFPPLLSASGIDAADLHYEVMFLLDL